MSDNYRLPFGGNYYDQNGVKQNISDLANGISYIEKTGTEGLVDTYVIYYTNGSTQTYTITNGVEGKSAYEVWLDAGNIGTEADYIISLKGETGADGADGKSAYEVWLDAGNTGTEADYILSLKGETGADGADGKSAYEVWLDAGNTGTEADYILSLKGETGADGSDAESGIKKVDSLPAIGVDQELYRDSEGNIFEWFDQKNDEYPEGALDFPSIPNNTDQNPVPTHCLAEGIRHPIQSMTGEEGSLWSFMRLYGEIETMTHAKSEGATPIKYVGLHKIKSSSADLEGLDLFYQDNDTAQWINATDNRSLATHAFLIDEYVGLGSHNEGTLQFFLHPVIEKMEEVENVDCAWYIKISGELKKIEKVFVYDESTDTYTEVIQPFKYMEMPQYNVFYAYVNAYSNLKIPLFSLEEHVEGATKWYLKVRINYEEPEILEMSYATMRLFDRRTESDHTVHMYGNEEVGRGDCVIRIMRNALLDVEKESMQPEYYLEGRTFIGIQSSVPISNLEILYFSKYPEGEITQGYYPRFLINAEQKAQLENFDILLSQKVEKTPGEYGRRVLYGVDERGIQKMIDRFPQIEEIYTDVYLNDFFVGKTMLCMADITVFVEEESADNPTFPEGCEINIIKGGGTAITIKPNYESTLVNNKNNDFYFTMTEDYKEVKLKKLTTNNWVLIGDVTEVPVT